MTGRELGAGRGPHGWRAAAIAATVAVAVIAAVGSVLGSSGARATASTQGISRTGQAAAAPLAGVSRTPAGWSPVPYKNAQLSVPGSSWLVESPQQLSCGFPQISGMIFVGVKPGFPKAYACTVTASVAWILPAGPIPKGITHRKPTAVIGGIPVYRLSNGKGTTAYLVPELGVRIGARGKLAARVLATLTRSPLSVALRPGAAARVPAGWTRRQLGGVRFAAPPSWTLQREDQWSTCGTGLEPSSLLLIDATRPPLYLPCPYPLPTAIADQAKPGLTVVTGKYAAQSVGQSYASCQSRRGVRICLSSVTGQGGFLSGVLVFSVSRPKQPATFFLLGLYGSGSSARAVFDSVRAA
ncbi:MAG: hypothetical protein ABSA02_36870 [Trebonia sp.]|jgi:hypothetical protein